MDAVKPMDWLATSPGRSAVCLNDSHVVGAALAALNLPSTDTRPKNLNALTVTAHTNGFQIL